MNFLRLIVITAILPILQLGCKKEELQILHQVVDIDGNIYDTIIIGNQVWFKENLRTTHYNDGSVILNITDNKQWYSDTLGAYCNYMNDTSYVEKYGRLYNGYVVVNDNVCPVGWHVPSKDDWDTLTTYLAKNSFNLDSTKQEDFIASSMASTEDWQLSWVKNSVGRNLDSNNSSGFSAYPAGYRDIYGGFYKITIATGWWTTSQIIPNTEEACGLTFDYTKFIRWGFSDMKQGFSIRCVKDNPVSR